MDEFDRIIQSGNVSQPRPPIRHGRQRPQTALSALGIAAGVIVGACAGIAAFGLLDPILRAWGL